MNAMQISNRRQIVISVKRANLNESALKLFLSKYSTNLVSQASWQYSSPMTSVFFPKGKLSLTLEIHQSNDDPPGSSMQMQDACKRPIILLAHGVSTLEDGAAPTPALPLLLSHHCGGWGLQAMRFLAGVPRATTECISQVAQKHHTSF